MKSSSSYNNNDNNNRKKNNNNNKKTTKEYNSSNDSPPPPAILDSQIYSSPSSSYYTTYSSSSITNNNNNSNELQKKDNRTIIVPKHKKTESITFRLDSIILNKLHQEAEQKDISVNTLVSQIIKQHTDWHSNAAKAGFISVRRALVVKLMDKISEQDITSIAEYIAKSSNKDFILLLKNQYNIESALEFIESWIRISGYPYRHEVDGDNNTNNNNNYNNTNSAVHSYIIQHDMGRKWSLYLSELYRHLFEEFGLAKPYFDITDNVLSFKVDTERMV